MLMLCYFTCVKEACNLVLPLPLQDASPSRFQRVNLFFLQYSKYFIGITKCLSSLVLLSGTRAQGPYSQILMTGGGGGVKAFLRLEKETEKQK